MNKIIQCPACNTKFAINESQILGVENPKFHCSRCSTVFSLEDDSSPKSSHALDLLRSLQNKEDETPGDVRETEFENQKDLPEDLPVSEQAWSLGVSGAGEEQAPSSANTEGTDFDEGKFSDETDEESQLSLFPELDSETHYIDDEDIESGKIKGISVSWESSNPDLPYEVDLSSQKRSRELAPDDTKVFSRDTLGKDSPKEEKGSASDLLTKMAGTALVPFKDTEKDKQVESGSKEGDVLLRSLTSEHDEASSESINRSMQHTTVLKRDGLGGSSFSLQEEDFKNFLKEEDSEHIPLIKRDSVKWDGFSFKGINIKPPSFLQNISDLYVSFLVAWSLPFFLMLILCFWAFRINEHSLGSENRSGNHGVISSYFASLLGLTTPLAIKAPPQGVSFSPVNATVTASSDSKSGWIIIKGYILNTSDEAIPSMEIVSLLYDKNQKLLKKHSSVIPNSLHKLDFQSFTDADIKHHSQNHEKKEYLPHTSKQVALAIEENPETKWFATRVFAARF